MLALNISNLAKAEDFISDTVQHELSGGYRIKVLMKEHTKERSRTLEKYLGAIGKIKEGHQRLARSSVPVRCNLVAVFVYVLVGRFRKRKISRK